MMKLLIIGYFAGAFVGILGGMLFEAARRLGEN